VLIDRKEKAARIESVWQQRGKRPTGSRRKPRASLGLFHHGVENVQGRNSHGDHPGTRNSSERGQKYSSGKRGKKGEAEKGEREGIAILLQKDMSRQGKIIRPFCNKEGEFGIIVRLLENSSPGVDTIGSAI